MKAKSTRKRAPRKSADFPLSKHPRGYWCKRYKLTGTRTWKMVYFEKVADDPDGAKSLEDWARNKDRILAGLPRPAADGSDDRLTLVELCDRFLVRKQAKLDASEITLVWRLCP